MKEKDFDDIGKRLYDQEADPPKDGMKKIHSMLHGAEKSGKVISIGKNWWKALLLVTPLVMYWIYTELHVDQPYLASSVKDSGLSEAIDQTIKESQETETEIKGIQSTDGTNQSDLKNSVGKKLHPQTNLSKPYDNYFAQKTISSDYQKSQIQREIHKNSSTDGSTFDGISIKDSTALQTNIDPVKDDELQVFMASQDESNSIGKQDSSQQAGLIAVSENKPSKASSISSDSIDQVIVPEINSDKNLQDKSDITAPNRDTTTRTQKTPWRINASFTPHYLTQPVQPDTNDEVLVTDINNTNKSYRFGYGVGIGIGKEVTRDFYLDGHITYTDIRQDLKFSYTTGNIDTLLAIQQPDQSILIIPVYENTEREMSNHYGYAGVRLGATYYFWKKERSRFNLTTSAGLHYLVLADIREKIAGEWVSLSNENLNRQNFSFAIGAGYNINLKQGWEIMINPVLTYFTQKVKNQELPYSFNQQLIGLNLMLSKTLGSKN
jgi:hypothetical protein